ncbi:Hypothetical_protein [Hexamita inflata]|uniref:Hypothetical_protein n=1 Tax=Hexamita inflata TaxID=28002 RepID=A0ABP1H8W4_9EUKA
MIYSYNIVFSAISLFNINVYYLYLPVIIGLSFLLILAPLPTIILLSEIFRRQLIHLSIINLASAHYSLELLHNLACKGVAYLLIRELPISIPLQAKIYLWKMLNLNDLWSKTRLKRMIFVTCLQESFA